MPTALGLIRRGVCRSRTAGLRADLYPLLLQARANRWKGKPLLVWYVSLTVQAETGKRFWAQELYAHRILHIGVRGFWWQDAVEFANLPRH